MYKERWETLLRYFGTTLASRALSYPYAPPYGRQKRGLFYLPVLYVYFLMLAIRRYHFIIKLQVAF